MKSKRIIGSVITFKALARTRLSGVTERSLMNRHCFSVVLCVALLFQGTASYGWGYKPTNVKRDRILIIGKEYSLEESIPIIVDLLQRSGQTEKIVGLKAARDWAWQLKGTDIIPQIISAFDTETNMEVRQAALLALCRILDERSVSVFKKAADSDNELFRFGGLIGLGQIEGPEVVPRLVDAMISTHNPSFINSAIQNLRELVGSEFELPPKEVWISANERSKYTKRFDLWWQRNKDRLISEWKTQCAVERNALKNESGANASTAITPKSASTTLPQRATQKTAHTENYQETQNLSIETIPSKNRLVKLIASSAACLAILCLFLWVIFRKRP